MLNPPNPPVTARGCKLIAFDVRIRVVKGYLAPHECRPDEFHEPKSLDPERDREVREGKDSPGHAH